MLLSRVLRVVNLHKIIKSHNWYPQKESNLYRKLRRLVLYPLSYGDREVINGVTVGSSPKSLRVFRIREILSVVDRSNPPHFRRTLIKYLYLISMLGASIEITLAGSISSSKE